MFEIASKYRRSAMLMPVQNGGEGGRDCICLGNAVSPCHSVPEFYLFYEDTDVTTAKSTTMTDLNRKQF